MIAAPDFTENGEVTAAARYRARGCVIEYAPDAFELGKQLVVGRRVAGQSFLKALCRHSSSERLHCVAGSSQDFAQFARHVAQWSDRTKEACWTQESELGRLPDSACLVRMDPGIARLAWRRRLGDSRSYSLCGLTHTLCSDNVMDALGDLLIAPVQAWDAVVCTSQAVKDVVQELLGAWAEYLRSRIGGEPHVPLELPIIPLGVDCEAFARRPDHQARRKACRRKWNVAADEIVVLFVGRLSFHAKANPFPLFAAVRQAAAATRKKIRVVLAGQFANPSIQAAFVNAFRAICPGMALNIVVWTQDESWWDVWRGADIFVSLVDNIQETFGLTPLEGMAAGLPVVVSDWDGYRDTVRQGIDGFRIRTCMPAAGDGEEFIRRYFHGLDTYDRYKTAEPPSAAVFGRSGGEKGGGNTMPNLNDDSHNKSHQVHHFPAAELDLLGVTLPLTARVTAQLGLVGLHCGSGANLKPKCLNTDEAVFQFAAGQRTRPGVIALVNREFYYLQHDATEPLPIEDACFHWAYAEHLIEHISPPQGVELLSELRRVLRPGGVVRLSTPDLTRYMEGYSGADQRFFEEHADRLEQMGLRGVPRRKAWLVNQIFYRWGHRWIYDFEELRFAAVQAGFAASSVRRCRFREGAIPDVAAFDLAIRNDESLYVELVKQ